MKEVKGKKAILRQEHDAKSRSLVKKKNVKLREMERKFKELGLDG